MIEKKSVKTLRQSNTPGAHSSEDLHRFSEPTIAYYDRHADQFWQGTKDHDVSQNIAALLGAITTDGPLTLLDFGCGPGRDLRFFRALGHRAIGLDGSKELAKLASQHSGCEIWQQDFLDLSLPSRFFDGIYANASLFHVPSAALPGVLLALQVSLKPNGVLFSSNPRGDNREGWSHHRYGCYYDLDSWRGYLVDAGFAEIGHYFRPPGKPRAEQPWLASVWRKVVEPDSV